MQDVKPDASPGLPLMAQCSNNRQVFEKLGELLVDASVERIMLLLMSDPESVRRMSPWEKVNSGFCDPLRVFVKKEPHPVEKIREGRFRLICSVSLVDQIVERFFYTPQNLQEIADWADIPSRPGMGLTDGMVGQTSRYVASKVSSSRSPAFADSDMTGWDWSVQGWEYWCDWRRRVLLMTAVSDEDREIISRAMAIRHMCLMSSLLVMSSGEVFEQTSPGVMKSGSYLTSSSNSYIRAFLARLIGAEWSMAMGDDAVEGYVEGAKEKYRALGHSVKAYVRRDLSEARFDFCSTVHYIRDGNCAGEPANWAKSLYGFLCKPNSQELQTQLFYELRNSPQLSRIQHYCLQASGTGDNAAT